MKLNIIFSNETLEIIKFSSPIQLVTYGVGAPKISLVCSSDIDLHLTILR